MAAGLRVLLLGRLWTAEDRLLERAARGTGWDSWMPTEFDAPLSQRPQADTLCAVLGWEPVSDAEAGNPESLLALSARARRMIRIQAGGSDYKADRLNRPERKE